MTKTNEEYQCSASGNMAIKSSNQEKPHTHKNPEWILHTFQMSHIFSNGRKSYALCKKKIF